jgi:hypothetical protein
VRLSAPAGSHHLLWDPTLLGYRHSWDPTSTFGIPPPPPSGSHRLRDPTTFGIPPSSKSHQHLRDLTTLRSPPTSETNKAIQYGFDFTNPRESGFIYRQETVSDINSTLNLLGRRYATKATDTPLKFLIFEHVIKI